MKISRQRFTVTEEIEEGNNNFISRMEDFADSIKVPNRLSLSYVLKQAGVKNYEDIEEDCYTIAEKINAKKEFKGTNMTIDDIAVIASYTYGDDREEEGMLPPFTVLNRTIVRRSIPLLKKIMPYMMVLLKALRKLDRFENKGVLYRAIDCKNEYVVGSEKKWWGLTSTTLKRNVANNFLSESCNTLAPGKVFEGTLFVISKGWGYDMRPFSFFSEEEILLDIERTVRIKSVKTGGFQEVEVELVETDLIFKDEVEKFPSFGIYYSTPSVSQSSGKSSGQSSDPSSEDLESQGTSSQYENLYDYYESFGYPPPPPPPGPYGHHSPPPPPGPYGHPPPPPPPGPYGHSPPPPPPGPYGHSPPPPPPGPYGHHSPPPPPGPYGHPPPPPPPGPYGHHPPPPPPGPYGHHHPPPPPPGHHHPPPSPGHHHHHGPPGHHPPPGHW